MKFRAQRFFGAFLIVFFVGFVFYYVFQVIVPLEAPLVTHEFLEGERKVSVSVPYRCDEVVRVFRSRDDGFVWDRVRSFSYQQGDEACTFLEPAIEAFASVSSLLYRYEYVDMEKRRSTWSDVEKLAF